MVHGQFPSAAITVVHQCAEDKEDEQSACYKQTPCLGTALVSPMAVGAPLFLKISMWYRLCALPCGAEMAVPVPKQPVSM